MKCCAGCFYVNEARYTFYTVIPKTIFYGKQFVRLVKSSSQACDNSGFGKSFSLLKQYAQSKGSQSTGNTAEQVTVCWRVMDCVNVPANLEGALTATQSVMHFICMAYFQWAPKSTVHVLIEHYANPDIAAVT